MNSLGKQLRVTTFGESHGPAIGGIIDGFPPGFKINFDELADFMARRAPGSSPLVTARKESDMPEFLSGISSDGITLGTPIGFIIRNTDTKSGDYDEYADKFRPNHADYAYLKKYGIRDPRGGGRSSARETANWCVAGAIASQWLASEKVDVKATLTGVGNIKITIPFEKITNVSSKELFSVSPEEEMKMHNLVAETKAKGDSVGGEVSCLITGLKAGLGSPVFDKLQSRLAAAMMSINAAKAFEYGLGSAASSSFGSETTDLIESPNADGSLRLATNFSGGIQGGITVGVPVYFKVHFKPTPTLLIPMPTINEKGEKVILNPKGRHDPCVAIRAAVVVEALAALVVADMMIQNEGTQTAGFSF